MVTQGCLSEVNTKKREVQGQPKHTQLIRGQSGLHETLYQKDKQNKASILAFQYV